MLVMDGQQGLTSADQEVVSWLRKTHPNKPLLLAVNKCENPQKADIQVRLPLLNPEIRVSMALRHLCQVGETCLLDWVRSGIDPQCTFRAFCATVVMHKGTVSEALVAVCASVSKRR